MSDSYQFGLHVLFIVAIVQFVLGAAAVWLFGGPPKLEAAPIADPIEMEAIREKQRNDQKSVEDAMKQIYRLTGRIGHDVGEHSARVKQINEEIVDASARGDAEGQASLVAAIAKITEANEKLQSDLRSAEAKMAEQATALESQMAMARTDALTGVLNRRAFDDEILRRVSEYQRYRSPASSPAPTKVCMAQRRPAAIASISTTARSCRDTERLRRRSPSKVSRLPRSLPKRLRSMRSPPTRCKTCRTAKRLPMKSGVAWSNTNAIKLR